MPVGRIEKFFLDYRTDRDIGGLSRWRALLFAASNPKFPKWEDVMNQI